MSENTTNLNEEKIEETNEEINKQNVGKNENIPPFNAQTNGTDPSFMVDGKEFIYNYKGKMVKKPFYSFSYAILTMFFTPLLPFFLYKKYWQGIVFGAIYVAIPITPFIFSLFAGHIMPEKFVLFVFMNLITMSSFINYYIFFAPIILGFIYPKVLPIKRTKESIFSGILAIGLLVTIPLIPIVWKMYL